MILICGLRRSLKNPETRARLFPIIIGLTSYEVLEKLTNDSCDIEDIVETVDTMSPDQHA